MQLAFLAEQKVMDAKPDNVEIIQNWGDTTAVFYPEDNPTNIQDIKNGDHIVAEGEPEAIKKWLKPFNPIPITQGRTMFEKFRLKDVG